MRARLRLPAVLVLATLAAPCRELIGQDDSGWRMSFTPYAWIAGITGTVGFAGGAADVDLNAGDIIDKVDISVMFLLEARRERWILRLDAMPKPADAADALALAITHIWRGGAQARIDAAVATWHRTSLWSSSRRLGVRLPHSWVRVRGHTWKPAGQRNCVREASGP